MLTHIDDSLALGYSLEEKRNACLRVFMYTMDARAFERTKLNQPNNPNGVAHELSSNEGALASFDIVTDDLYNQLNQLNYVPKCCLIITNCCLC